MLCKDLMSYPVIFNKEDDSILKVSKTMDKYNIGFIPIVDSDNNLIGVITDFDIIKRVISKDIPLTNHISNYLTKEVIYCYVNQDISLAISKMADYQIKRIIVLDLNNKMVGIISIKDIATNQETNKYLNDLLLEIKSDELLNPIKYYSKAKKI